MSTVQQQKNQNKKKTCLSQRVSFVQEVSKTIDTKSILTPHLIKNPSTLKLLSNKEKDSAPKEKLIKVDDIIKNVYKKSF